VEETMGAAPYESDLASFADDTVQRSLAPWDTPGVIESVHPTPFGELPGSVVIHFPTIDALAHAWDLSTSVGQRSSFRQRRCRRSRRWSIACVPTPSVGWA